MNNTRPGSSTPTPTPLRYAVLGHPVAHSLSPRIHARFAELTQEPILYERLLCPLDGFVAELETFAAHAAGCNITVPFKQEAFEFIKQKPETQAQLTPRALLAGAINTLRFAPGPWLADNTDGVGLVNDIQHHAGVSLQGKKILLMGAGGAARGALGPLLEAHPRQVVVANRTLDKAQALIAAHQSLAQTCAVSLQAQPLQACGEAFDVVINGTAASLSGEDIPISAQALRPACLVVDMMYGDKAQGFLTWAANHGALTRDGLGMLVEQAAEAFALWRGVRPDSAQVLRELQQAFKPV